MKQKVVFNKGKYQFSFVVLMLIMVLMLGSSLGTGIGLLPIRTGMWDFVVVIFVVLVFNDFSLNKQKMKRLQIFFLI